MLKAATERHLEDLCEAIGETIRGVRPAGSDCRLCGQPAGIKHADGCELWPIIRARGRHRAQERPAEQGIL